MSRSAGLEKDFNEKTTVYFAKSYETRTDQNWIRYDRRELIEALALPHANGATVIDIGCGPHPLFPQILNASEQYFAFDVVDSNLRHLETIEPTIKTVLGSIDGFSWDEEAYDLIVCSGSLEYAKDPLAGLAAILKHSDAEAAFVGSFPNVKSPSRLWIQYVDIPIKNLLSRKRRERYYHRHLFSADHVKSVLKTQGFDDIKIIPIGFFFLPYPIARLFPGLNRRVSEFLAKRAAFLGAFASEFVIEARKTAGAQA